MLTIEPSSATRYALNCLSELSRMCLRVNIAAAIFPTSAQATNPEHATCTRCEQQETKAANCLPDAGREGLAWPGTNFSGRRTGGDAPPEIPLAPDYVVF
jgi:hypothetical protein